MSELIVSIILAFLGVIGIFITYRGIRRGGARYYTLEREALLRQASLTLWVSMLLFLGAIGLLAYQMQQTIALEATAEETPATENGATQTQTIAEEATPELNTLPPLPTITPTPGPTATATALICRASVEGTGGNGLTLRTAPGGEEVDVLAEAALLTVITEEPAQEINGLVWRKVRSLFGDEGWVAETFLTLGAGCE